jgi:hypothetical protein
MTGAMAADGGLRAARQNNDQTGPDPMADMAAESDPS